MDNTNYFERYFTSGEPVFFELNVPMDKKHIIDYNNFGYRIKNRKIFLLNAVTGAVCILLGALAGSSFTVILGVLCIALPYISLRSASVRSLENAYCMGNGDNYRFYADYFADRSNFSLEVMPYELVAEAFETEDYFFIFQTSNKAYIIPKYCFIYGDPLSFRAMLSEKLGSRFHIKTRKGS